MSSDAHKEAHTRRTFLRRSIGAALQGSLLIGALIAISRMRLAKRSPFGPRIALGIIRPPGSLAEAEFMSACIRCTRCADACKSKAIQLFGSETGIQQGTPHIIPEQSACNMCLACGEACPTGAIEPLTQKEDITMGLAVVDDRLCVSINGTGVCGACYTACPFRGQAITQGIRNAPTVHPEFCTGCGLCEEFCIVDERVGIRAIQVNTDRAWPGLAKAA